MQKIQNKSFHIVPEMPDSLKANLEFSSAMDLFRIASEHNLQYLTLVDAAWKDIQPVIDWFIETKQYNQGIEWLCRNTPDVLPRILAINNLIQEERKNKEPTK